MRGGEGDIRAEVELLMSVLNPGLEWWWGDPCLRRGDKRREGMGSGELTWIPVFTGMTMCVIL